MNLKVAAVPMFLLLAGCGVSSAGIGEGEFEDLGIAEGEARVTPEQAVAAKAIVDSTKAWLPYAFKEDGCYARALYMSMELAGRGVPSSAQYIQGRLQPTPSIEWGYHVAPMVEVIGTTGRTILDPALAPGGPVTLTQWIALNKPFGSYQLSWTLGSEYVMDGSVRWNAQQTPVIESFSQLKPFKRTDVEQACDTMFQYMEYEGLSGTATKQRLLLGRTRTLLNRLYSVGKLTGYTPGASVSCGSGGQVPLCREPGNSCSAAGDCCSLNCVSGACRPTTIDSTFDAGTSVTPTPDAGTPSGTPALGNKVAVSLSGAANTSKQFTFDVPAGSTSLAFEIKGGSGDADLYVRYGAAPTTATWDVRPYLDGSNEKATIASVKAGTWYVMVRGYSAYSNVSLTASRSP